MAVTKSASITTSNGNTTFKIEVTAPNAVMLLVLLNAAKYDFYKGFGDHSDPDPLPEGWDGMSDTEKKDYLWGEMSNQKKANVVLDRFVKLVKEEGETQRNQDKAVDTEAESDIKDIESFDN